MNFSSKHWIIDGDMTADITGEAYDIKFQLAFTVNFVWTGTPTGNVGVEGSTDGENWFVISPAVQATAGAAGDHTVDYASPGFIYMRPYFTFTSGSGTLQAYVSTKGA